MQTVNFNCPHCGNLMAVGTNLLGRNVRCPHCKQVVRAPAAPGEPLVQTPAPPPTPPPPPTAPAPMFDIPKPIEHHESIFGERHDEDVFGSEPPKPMLPAPAPSRPAPVENPTAPTLPVVEQPLTPNSPTAATLDFSPMADGALEDRRSPPPAREGRVDSVYRPRGGREEAATTPAFAWILLVYAALVTVAAGYFGYQYFMAAPKEEHPYKAMPDVIREYKPAEKRQMSFQGMPDPKLDIPKELRVKLGEEITIGDLKVQPLYVEKKVLEATTKYVSADDRKRSIGATLVLTLRVRNLSSDATFCPNDPAFVRATDSKQPAPYTALQIHREFFYGPFKWPPDAGTEREYVDGQEPDEQPLKPGEERDSWVTVCPPGVRTSGNQDIIRTLRDLGDKQELTVPLLWRVQLRRGLMKMKNDAGQDVDVSTTAVIGVEFQAKDIKGL